ncbi:hypothetical protein P5673_032924 [Acropora cervicornis]|uniref:Uncharacterized protein n=1 Tax=Acropora cervicornis TaxID=6130 RepID=A0AAD9URG0_ACRCE|nr:hypothetical protein P5673_032924 [Acropora cervicornis]
MILRTLWRTSFVHSRKTAVMTKLILKGFGFLGGDSFWWSGLILESSLEIALRSIWNKSGACFAVTSFIAAGSYTVVHLCWSDGTVPVGIFRQVCQGSYLSMNADFNILL